MSRTTNINVNVNSGKSVATITKIKEAFIDLKNAKDSVGKDGKIALTIDLKGMDKATLDMIAKSISKLSNSMKKLKENSDSFADMGKVINANTNNITNNVYKTTKSVDNLGNSFKKTNADMLESVVVFETIRRSVSAFMRDYNKLVETTFNVGIASQMNLKQIEMLNSSFLQLSTTVPSSAQEMASAVDALIRTGRTFEESRKIIEQVAILSTASGDSLKDTSEVVTKVMVSLGISSEKVKETLTAMHSTAIQTASDMGYLAEAFKNVAGTASVLVKQSGLSGQELEDYRQKILDVTMASIGSMANLGLSASQAGTKVKNLFGKLTAGEKSARALFDTAMKLNNIKLDNFLGKGAGDSSQLFDFDALSDMTKKDLPQALNIMSQMYVKGQLSTQVMQKMFTARHFMEISNLLIDINGNIDGFVDGIAKGVSYSDDFYKKMFDINEQMKVFKNNMQTSLGGTGEVFNKAGTGILMMLNEQLPSINKEFSDMTGIIGTIGTTFTVASLSAGVFMKTILPFITSGIVAGGAIGVGIGAIVTAVGAIGYNFLEAKKQTADLNINLNKNLLLNKEIEAQLKSSLNIRNMINNTIKESIDSQGKSLVMLDESSTMMSLLLDKNKEFKNILDAISDTKAISEEMKPKIDMTILDDLEKRYEDILVNEKNSIQKIFTEINNFKDRLRKDIGKEELLYSKGKSDSAFNIEKYYKEIKNADIVYSKIEEMAQKGLDIETMLSDLGKYGIKDRDVAKIIGTDISSINNELASIIESKEKAKERIKAFNEEIKESFRTLNEQITANNKALNMVVARQNQIKLSIFEKSGEYKGKKGFEGMFEIAESSSIEAVESSLNMYEEKLKAIRKERSFLNKQRKDSLLSEEEYVEKIKEVQIAQQNVTDAIKNQDEIRQKGIGIEKESFLNQFKGMEYTARTSDIMLQMYTTQMKINELKSKEVQDVALISKMEDMLKDLQALLKIEDELAKSKQRKSDYQLKYNNYVKENLSVELELAKILQTQGQQRLLSYEYRKKELDLNKELLAQDVKLARKTLAETGYNNADIKTSAQAQEALRNMYKTHGAVTQNENVKKQFDALKVLTQSLAKEEKLVMEIALQPLKEFESVINNMPNTIKNTYTALKGISGDTSLSPLSMEYVNYLSSHIKNSMEKLKDSWKTELGASLFDGITEENLDDFIVQYKNSVLKAEEQASLALQKRTTGESLSEEELEYISLLSEEEKKLQDLISLKDEIIERDKQALEIEMSRLNIINQMGNVLSKMGSTMNLKGLEDVGNIFNSLGDVSKFYKDPKNKFDFSNLFDTSDMSKWTDNFSKMLESSLKGIDLGSTVGSWIGGITGGGASAQAGGALGGMIAGAGGASALAGAMGMAGSALATGGASLAISAGMSLIGGLFDSGEGDQEEANKRTAEAKKVYDKNTEALNKLAQNMSNLSGGIDGLNNSLISAFSKIPTFGKLTSVEGTLKDMYKTMEATRKFNDVAYQVTKTKKGKKGFMGIGATAGSTWTETIELSVQEMLNRYGFQGTIEDMTTQQMRDFSKWLEDYDLGDTDNFSILANALEDYAEALDKFDKNIDKFFYDTTMESFAGISSLQQEELRQQIEDFYKNLGFQIDEEMSKEIDKLAEQMSVMVTIMQDVRGSFIDSWRESGKDAGSAFLSSMTPYIDAMLENISQVFYDVYFSDVTDALEKEFKILSEQLVELKKQGDKLDWNSVAGSLSGSFEKILSSIISAKQETESFNDIILELQKQALEAGLSLSEMLELGLVSGTQKDVLESFKDALLSSDSEGALTTIGEMVGDKIGNAMANKLLDNMLSDRILQFSANIDKVISGGMSMDSLAGLATEAMSVGLMLEDQRRRLEAIKSMFDFSGDITYESQESNIKYETGTSTQVVNNYYLSASVEAGNVIESDSIERLTDALIDSILEKLKVDKGIDLANISRNY
ncbi:MAG: phage tail tape measure protein [Clostridium chrysemydis]|uniref:phage tail tape measure protein n=1 Tax=Clostridium chrysemydis TaxID=2665504 RepID=UPI003F38824F